MLAYDLFAGAGGASTGLVAAGYDVIGFELNKQAAAAHQANGHPTVVCDLNTWPWYECLGPDLLWASPPCQPFSAAGNHDGHLDPRDGMPALLRAVGILMPPVVVMENVKGLTFKKHRWYLDDCVRNIQGMGYHVEWCVLNCANFGVPQTRERLILIARCDGKPIVWPTPTHAKVPGLYGEQPWVSMAEALGWGMTERPYPTLASSRTTGGPDAEGVGGSGGRHALYSERDAGRWVENDPEPQPHTSCQDYAEDHKAWEVRVGFRRKGDDLGPQTPDGYRERDTRPIDQPAQAVTEKARGWTVFGDVVSSRGTTRPMDEPAPTLTSAMDNGNFGFMLNTGCDWKAGEDRSSAQKRNISERPAPTLSAISASQWWIERPATTINADNRVSVPGHHGPESGSQQRGAIKITPEQAACLQGFPEGYRFLGTRTAQFRQIGNAVPPPLVEAVVRAL